MGNGSARFRVGLEHRKHDREIERRNDGREQVANTLDDVACPAKSVAASSRPNIECCYACAVRVGQTRQKRLLVRRVTGGLLACARKGHVGDLGVEARGTDDDLVARAALGFV